MKRSEMILLLEQMIRNWDEIPTKRPTYIQLCEDILNTIEDCGMSPEDRSPVDYFEDRSWEPE